jgi:hypothetical protein
VGTFNVTINTDTPAFLDPERRVWATDADARSAGVRLILAALSKRLDRDGALTPGMGGTASRHRRRDRGPLVLHRRRGRRVSRFWPGGERPSSGSR